MNDKGWSFPRNDFGPRQGISESGVETFKGSPVKALAREVSQNSLDASQDGKSVILEFDFFRIKASNFPGKSDLDDALNKSLKTWEYQKHDKTKNFIKKAQKVLSSEKISFLRISDYNTHGLRGSNQKGSDWDNLVKSSGSSDKSSDAGGSYGIGKFAPFACSDLRTIFYSTLDTEGQEATQGIARLVSHKIDLNKDEETQGTGFYGVKDKHQPIYEYMSLQEEFYRTEPGTDIFIAGFNKNDDWKTQIIKEILDGFLYAIYKGDFIVRVDNKITLKKETLEDVINEYRMFLPNETLEYYKVLTSAETTWYEEDIKQYGNIRLGLQINQELTTRRVAMIRNPWMKIYNQAQISSTTPFAGLFIVEGKELNEFLRKMENPKHDDWEPDRLEQKALIKEGKKIKKYIKKLIRNKLEELMTNKEVETLDIEGAGDYIPLEDEANENTSNIDDDLNPKFVETEVNEIEKIKDKSNEKDATSRQESLEMIDGGVIDEGDEVYINISENDGEKINEPKPGDYGGKIDENKNGNAYQKQSVKPNKINLLVLNRLKNEYRLVLSTDDSLKECVLKIYKMDEQGKREKIHILHSQSGSEEISVIDDNISGFDINYTENKIIDFKTNEKNYFSAEVDLVGIKE